MPAKTAMGLEDLFKMKAVGRSVISPDATRVVYELKRFDLAENKNFVQLVWVDTASGKGRPLTSGKWNDTSPRWSPDGTRLGFLSDREKGCALFVLEMDGGDPRRLTDLDGHVHDFDWSPDGRRLVYTYQEMNEREKRVRDGKQDEIKKLPQFKHITRLFHKLDGRGWWNGNYTHVFSISSEGGKPKRLTQGNFDHAEPRFSPNGKRISYLSNRVENPDTYSDNADIYVVAAGGGKSKKITQMPGTCAGHAWSPDGQWFVYVGNSAKRGEGWKHLERVWIVAAEGGKPRELLRSLDNNCRNLTLGDVAFSPFDVAAPIWSSDGTRVHFLVSEEGACRLYSRSIKKNDLRCEIGGNVNIYSVQRTGADGPLVLSMGTATDPGDVAIAHPQDGFRLTRLSDVNRELLERRTISTPEAISIKSGPIQVRTWVLKPPGFNPQRKYPAILEIHGGPAAQYGHSFFHEMQWLAAKGYVVVYSNPRGSAGYGLKFQNCIRADWGSVDYQDLMRVADWMWSRPFIDKARIGVTGGSYGGYMTNWIVGHTNRFKAAVSQRSVVNLESMFGTSDYGYDLGHMFGGLPWIARKEYLRQSPLTYARNVHTPLLIEHEEEDHRCPIEQAEQLFYTLKYLGRTVELVRFEGESHGLSRGGRPQNRAERLKRIAGWFDKYLK